MIRALFDAMAHNGWWLAGAAFLTALIGVFIGIAWPGRRT